MVSQTKQKRIFISYQRKDQKFVQNLVHVLQKSGKYEVWYDQDLRGGQNWWNEIIANIEKAEIVILVLSQNYLKSTPCELERGYANTLAKAIIPLKIDAKLAYNSLPSDIAALQIRQYFGQADQYQVLLDDLDALNSPPLPQTMPVTPPAPSGKSQAPRTRLIQLAAIGFVIALILLGIFFLNTYLPTMQGNETPSNSTTSPTLAAIEGFDLSLQFGAENSFTIIVNKPSNLWGIRLSSTISDEDIVLTERFPDLQSLDYQLPAGACLRFEREGTSPVVPLACHSGQMQRLILSPAEVFWFDSSSNLYANVILRHGDDAPQLCPHNNGNGNCKLIFEE